MFPDFILHQRKSKKARETRSVFSTIRLWGETKKDRFPDPFLYLFKD